MYHQCVQASLLKPPVAAWEDGLARRRKALLKPEDPQTFFLDFLPEEWRLIRRDGIQMFNIHYWDKAMKRLRTEGRRLVDERLIFETALAQRKLVDSARRSTTRKRRNKERLQHLQAISANTRVASDSAQTSEDSSLPPFGVEEWS